MSNGQEWNIRRLLEWTTDYFANNLVDSARLCAEILLAHSLKCQRIELYTRFDQCPAADILAQFRDMVKRCAAHEPVAYLVGYKEFFSLKFEVTPAVLIPRPETELLVSHALDYIKNDRNGESLNCLDLCCGSGCIAIALARHAAELRVICSDISGEALAVAGRNIEKFNFSERITTCQSDLFDSLAQSGYDSFDLIVSNPPYISDFEFGKVEDTVSKYEPHLALRAPGDGLDFYRRIVARAADHLAGQGALFVEIGYEQGQKVYEIFKQSGYLTNIEVIKDTAGNNRLVKATKM